jgi:hypothetical protein
VGKERAIMQQVSANVTMDLEGTTAVELAASMIVTITVFASAWAKLLS